MTLIVLLVSFMAIGATTEDSCQNAADDNPEIFGNGTIILRALLLLPFNNTYLASRDKVAPAIQATLAKVHRLGILPETLRINVTSVDTYCDATNGTWAALRPSPQHPHLFLGPHCDYVVAPVARLLRFMQIPAITSGALAHDFGDEKAKGRRDPESEYHLLVRTGWTFGGMAKALGAAFVHYHWRRFVALYEVDARLEVTKEHYCYLAMKAIYEELVLGSLRCQIEKHRIEESERKGERMVQFVQSKIGVKNDRIVVICASPDTVREMLLAAEKLGMISTGEYVFFSIELFTSKVESQRPWFRNGTDEEERNQRARKAYEALLTVTARVPDTEEYMNFSREVKEIAKKDFNFDYGQEEVNTFVTAFHEAVLLYSLALNETLTEGHTIANGSVIIQKMWNRTFEGITGTVTIDENGDRDADYSILDLNPETGIFEVVANYIGTEKKVVDEPGKTVHWAGGLTKPPRDTPLPPEKDNPHQNTIIVLSVIVACLMVGSAAIYRHYRKEAQLASMSWKIKWDEIAVSHVSKRMRRGSRLSLTRLSLTSIVSAETMPLLDLSHQAFTNTGFYKGAGVFLKAIHKSRIEINRPLLLEIKMIKDMQHNHVVRFIGAVVDYPHCYLVTEYFPRGSLQDILENDQIKLDWMFRFSLMHDLVKGMAYLHSTDVKSHGNLKSSNCLVDSRFALKITDFGLHSLRTSDDDELTDSYMFWKRQLWTSPELLRMPNPPAEGTTKGDVYSFALIAHEIAIRRGAFYLGGLTLTPKEIVEKVRRSSSPPFRPHLVDQQQQHPGRVDQQCDEEVIHMIKKCWTEDPAERPDFQALKSIIRRLNKDNDSGNILDNLLSRMEQYANNLEALVEERTADYLEEKRKAEDLLYQLLPKSVASQLIKGESVTAEAFDGVTIYFSDIVGFTEMSADCTPMEVVDLLNDLYTCFDSIIENFDVYKVETIGDAYMVVSGLPVRNGNLHAREIARMSLALLNTVKSFAIRHRPREKLRLRIGLHTGPCAAGVVGLKMPRYCLFGDTVNTASRMESTGAPLRIHLSTKTKEVLDTFHTFILECRGDIEIKGKGKMTTYWLMGEKPQQNHPPTTPNPLEVKKEQCTNTSTLTAITGSNSTQAVHETNL